MWNATEALAQERRQRRQADAAAHREVQRLTVGLRTHRAYGEPLPRLVWLRRWVLAP
jgi:hypothetical protein